LKITGLGVVLVGMLGFLVRMSVKLATQVG